MRKIFIRVFNNSLTFQRRNVAQYIFSKLLLTAKFSMDVWTSHDTHLHFQLQIDMKKVPQLHVLFVSELNKA